MTPAAIPVIQELDAGELRTIASRALKLQSAPEIEQLLNEALTNRRTLERH